VTKWRVAAHRTYDSPLRGARHPRSGATGAGRWFRPRGLHSTLASGRDTVGGFVDLVPDSRPERDSWEVSFVVLTRSQRETPLTLPFFSLGNLRSAVLRLQDLGDRVSVCQVKEAMSGGGSEAVV